MMLGFFRYTWVACILMPPEMSKGNKFRMGKLFRGKFSIEDIESLSYGLYQGQRENGQVSGCLRIVIKRETFKSKTVQFEKSWLIVTFRIQEKMLLA